jgi:hypothetical protein
MRNSFLRLTASLLAMATLILGLTILIINDNNRIDVIRQEIVIPDLPAQFDGFTILQLTDLHSRRFGAEQADLAQVINALDFDLVAVTGDMQDHDGDVQPFFELLNAMIVKNPLLFVAGNAGAYDVNLFTGYITDEGKLMQSAGCRLMDRPFIVERDGSRLWFSELYYETRPEILRKSAEKQLSVLEDPESREFYKDQVAFQLEIESIFAGFQPDDTLIGITHHPVTQATLENPDRDMLPFDLVIAGHYHGGQIRLPIIGALYIPARFETRYGFFPDQRIVSGLYEGQGMQQYVSRGLGAGGPIPFLQFRLFNPPEINLLILRSADS